ncbi:hypothetical protein [Candidatus Marithrix sp. Canyon 246]|uniref:hypothetical protein n=1 Tax=Candidatus Marithrix sp. Canyon 246 TaxID=1827136 RepID=UPI00084A0CDA|nr:hypothetical protein [Candidatus Marithrix sp. Canyon 246]
MYLTVSTGTTFVTRTQTALMGRVEKSIYGNFPVQNICVSQEPLQDGSVAIKPVLECLNEVAPDKTTIFIAFTFIDGGDAAGLEHYLKARAPALAKHGGKVLLSATNERGIDWDFDGV